MGVGSFFYGRAGDRKQDINSGTPCDGIHFIRRLYLPFSIQNYNKSRIHSFRGAKDIEIHLDDFLVFRGEIAKASGDVQGDSESFGDVSACLFVLIRASYLGGFFYALVNLVFQTILFTTDEEILEAIAVNDNSFVDSVMDEFFPDEIEATNVRPSTGNEPAEVGVSHLLFFQDRLHVNFCMHIRFSCDRSPRLAAGRRTKLTIRWRTRPMASKRQVIYLNGFRCISHPPFLSKRNIICDFQYFILSRTGGGVDQHLGRIGMDRSDGFGGNRSRRRSHSSDFEHDTCCKSCFKTSVESCIKVRYI